jgi:hypothetical protein
VFIRSEGINLTIKINLKNYTKLFTNRAASDICKVELIIHQLDISSNGRQCDTDYVELPDKSRLCGKVPFQKRVYQYSPSSDYLIIQFKSDDYNERGMIGFWIEVKQVRHSCDHKTTQNGI